MSSRELHGMQHGMTHPVSGQLRAQQDSQHPGDSLGNDTEQFSRSLNATDNASETPNASPVTDPPSPKLAQRLLLQQEEASPQTLEEPEGATAQIDVSKHDAVIDHDGLHSTESATVPKAAKATRFDGDNLSQEELSNNSLTIDVRQPGYKNSASGTSPTNSCASPQNMRRTRGPFLPSSRTVVKPADPVGNWGYLRNVKSPKSPVGSCGPTFGESMTAYQFRGAARTNVVNKKASQPSHAPWRATPQRKPSDLGY
eukprot:TRINITY_DN11745_c0_g1_i1.p1 TRINITY_DN11745_c0_g1~~TRINITY_DN11745_c0_g1_i1.p1  ORF type:complete len:256 (-),score=29.77 TRINITY_DN11745_c0_g1_i1:150-917(-)